MYKTTEGSQITQITQIYLLVENYQKLSQKTKKHKKTQGSQITQITQTYLLVKNYQNYPKSPKNKNKPKNYTGFTNYTNYTNLFIGQKLSKIIKNYPKKPQKTT